MPLTDASLTSQLKGLTVDVARLGAGSPWYEQASDHFHYGFSRAKGLWLAAVEPINRCSHTPVMLFVFLKLDSRRRIRSVETAVCQTFNDGHYDELPVPFFPPDQDTARDLIVGALTKTSRAKLIHSAEVRW